MLTFRTAANGSPATPLLEVPDSNPWISVKKRPSAFATGSSRPWCKRRPCRCAHTAFKARTHVWVSASVRKLRKRLALDVPSAVKSGSSISISSSPRKNRLNVAFEKSKTYPPSISKRRSRSFMSNGFIFGMPRVLDQAQRTEHTTSLIKTQRASDSDQLTTLAPSTGC
ncbi:hypothetical protein D3C77_310310 [compost metagenome]